MNSIRKHGRPAFFLLVALSCAAQAQPKYTAIAIAKGYGTGINSEGDVVGTLSADIHAFLYKKEPSVFSVRFAIAYDQTDIPDLMTQSGNNAAV
jgi:hypothetical protein